MPWSSLRKIHLLLFFPIVVFLTLSSCDARSGYFKIKGRFLNMNQGEFYVYGPDGGTNGIDTIKVVGGRFSYDMPCERDVMLMLVFPNFSEQPIFAESGQVVEVQADASHMKEMEVKGTKTNELMTQFRKQIANASPPEAVKYAKDFINDHPESPVSYYLVRKYFIQGSSPDYSQAQQLIQLMMSHQEGNGHLIQLQRQVDLLAKGMKGKRVSSFKAINTEGREVTQNDVSDGVAVISVWATWRYDSQNQQRILRKLLRKYGNRLHLLSICVDGDVKSARRAIERDTLSWSQVCDEEMMEGDLLKSLGLMNIPGNMLLNNGTIVGRGLSDDALKEEIEKLLD